MLAVYKSDIAYIIKYKNKYCIGIKGIKLEDIRIYDKVSKGEKIIFPSSGELWKMLSERKFIQER